PQKYRPDIFPFYQPDRVKAFILPSKIREGQYRVINAAVPGYASGNVLAQLALQILPYQPDLIVVVDGYTDLMLPSKENQTDIPQLDNFLQNAPGHYQAYLSQSFNQWLNGFASVKLFKFFTLTSQPSIAQKSLVIGTSTQTFANSLPTDDAELARRVQRHQEHYKQMVRLCANARIPMVIAIQPEITGRPANQLSQAEKEIREQLGKDYLEKMPKAYNRLVSATQKLETIFPNQVQVVSFYPLGQNFPATTFLDTIHLSDKANGVVAEQLYQTLATWQKTQIIPENFNLKQQ
ncbi:MAG: SGNH/GDSL hydrolase family protein, partial [Microcystaceae cyanobacterium]